MDEPRSSYSAFEQDSSLKALCDATMDPPIQALYFLSGGAMTLI